MRRQGMEWTIALDPGSKAALDFATRGQPETFAISPDGQIVGFQARPMSACRARDDASPRRAASADDPPVVAVDRARGRRGGRARGRALAERRRSRAAARAHDLATELQVPRVRGLSVADSQAPTSQAIRADIKRRIAAGQSDAEIRQAYVDDYGESILLRRRARVSAYRVGAARARARARRHRDRVRARGATAGAAPPRHGRRRAARSTANRAR